MTVKTESPFETDPPVFLLKELTTRALAKHEHALAGQVLNQQHYLGDCPAGRQLLQVVEYDVHWVALLDWGPGCWKLADREAYIGWTHQQRSQRLGLVVQNRRFLVLGKERMPNLASRAMGLALRALPEHWESLHGYRPVLAETFTDIEQFEGTCYKATNWKPLGLTKGQMLGLREHFQKHFNDPRRDNRTYPASSLLVFITMALFAGRDTLTSIQRYGNLLTSQQRRWLDFPLKKAQAYARHPVGAPFTTS